MNTVQDAAGTLRVTLDTLKFVPEAAALPLMVTVSVFGDVAPVAWKPPAPATNDHDVRTKTTGPGQATVPDAPLAAPATPPSATPAMSGLTETNPAASILNFLDLIPYLH